MPIRIRESVKKEEKPVPICPFCSSVMNWMEDVSEPADLRPIGTSGGVWLNFSRFVCSICGFDARFRKGELDNFVKNQVKT